MYLLSIEDYKTLYAFDLHSTAERNLAEVLNLNGAANWTICPICSMDDFTHINGCSLLQEMDKERGE